MISISQFEVPTWSQVYDMLFNQSQKIISDGYKPDVIIGIALGGLVPTRILCDLLEIREIAIIQIEYYSGINQTTQEPVLRQCLNNDIKGKKVLLVDDVSDGGRSLQLARSHLQEQQPKEIRIATLYAKPGTITKPDYHEKETDHWIVFPWEARETIEEIIQKQESISATDKTIAKLVKAGFPKQLAEKFLSLAE